MRFSRVLLPAAFILIITPFTFAAPQHRETTTVEVVQVPVYVTTAGASVRGLTRDDFELRVNGRPQNIDYFDVIDFAALSPEQTRDPRQRRLYVLLFDLVYSSPNSIRRARIAAERYLDTAQASDYFSIALFNSTHLMEIVVPFTRDRKALRRAVASFDGTSSGDPLRLTVTPAQRPVFESDGRAEITDLQRMGMEVELAIAAAAGRIENQMDALGRLAERMAPLDGYKHVVLFSNGFDSSMATGVAPQWRGEGGLEIGPLANPAAFHAQPLPVSFEPRLPGSQRRMRKKFAAAGVFLDAVDVSGVRPFDMPSNDSLHFYTADTGGQVVEHRNNLTAAMQRLTDSQQVVYVLGFHAPDTGRSQNDIAVRVTGAPRGSTIGYRESYSSVAEKVSSRDGLHLADIVINDIPQNGLTLKTSVTTEPKRAIVNVALTGRELLALAGEDGKLTGEALMYVFAGQTSISFARKEISVDAVRARASGLDQNDVAMSQPFELPPGKYTVKVLVRIEGHDALAFAREDFTVGE